MLAEIHAIERAAVTAASTHPFDEWNPYVRAAVEYPLHQMLLRACSADGSPRIRDILCVALRRVPSVMRELPATLLALLGMRDQRITLDSNDVADNLKLASYARNLLRIEVSTPVYNFRIAVIHDAHGASFKSQIETVACNPWLTADQMWELNILECRRKFRTSAIELMMLNPLNRHPVVVSAIAKYSAYVREAADFLVERFAGIASLVRITLAYKPYEF